MHCVSLILENILGGYNMFLTYLENFLDQFEVEDVIIFSDSSISIPGFGSKLTFFIFCQSTKSVKNCKKMSAEEIDLRIDLQRIRTCLTPHLKAYDLYFW